MHMLCFTLTTIAEAYIELSYSFWIATEYNTMVFFPAIVGGAHGYTFILPMDSTNCWRGWPIAYNVHQLLY